MVIITLSTFTVNVYIIINQYNNLGDVPTLYTTRNKDFKFKCR